jgi:hypothetical protein
MKIFKVNVTLIISGLVNPSMCQRQSQSSHSMTESYGLTKSSRCSFNQIESPDNIAIGDLTWVTTRRRRTTANTVRIFITTASYYNSASKPPALDQSMSDTRVKEQSPYKLIAPAYEGAPPATDWWPAKVMSQHHSPTSYEDQSSTFIMGMRKKLIRRRRKKGTWIRLKPWCGMTICHIHPNSMIN